jgi:DNA repair protein RadC
VLEQILPVDCRDLAAKLIAEFGSMPKLVTASAERLHQVCGSPGAVAAIRTFRAAMLYTLRARLDAKPLIDDWRSLLDYLQADMAHHSIERFRVLHLNTRHILIRDEVMTEGTIDQAPIHVREVVRRAVELASSALILVHNHPNGTPSPSRADIDVTRALVAAGRPLGIAVYDHLIVWAGGHFSLRTEGLM